VEKIGEKLHGIAWKKLGNKKAALLQL